MTFTTSKFRIALAAPVLALGLAAAAPASAAGLGGAGGLSNAVTTDKAATNHLVQVRGHRFRGNRFRRNNRINRRRSHRRHRRNAVIGLGILGAAALLANRHYESRRRAPVYAHGRGGYRAAKRRCARQFDSYSWKSDTIINRYGDERLCPYVRRFH